MATKFTLRSMLMWTLIVGAQIVVGYLPRALPAVDNLNGFAARTGWDHASDMWHYPASKAFTFFQNSSDVKPAWQATTATIQQNNLRHALNLTFPTTTTTLTMTTIFVPVTSTETQLHAVNNISQVAATVSPALMHEVTQSLASGLGTDPFPIIFPPTWTPKSPNLSAALTTGLTTIIVNTSGVSCDNNSSASDWSTYDPSTSTSTVYTTLHSNTTTTTTITTNSSLVQPYHKTNSTTTTTNCTSIFTSRSRSGTPSMSLSTATHITYVTASISTPASKSISNSNTASSSSTPTSPPTSTAASSVATSRTDHNILSIVVNADAFWVAVAVYLLISMLS